MRCAFMCVYVRICVYMCIYVPTLLYIWWVKYVYICVYMWIYVSIHVCTYVYKCVYMCPPSLPSSIYGELKLCIYVWCVYMRICAYTCVYVCVYVHICTHLCYPPLHMLSKNLNPVFCTCTVQVVPSTCSGPWFSYRTACTCNIPPHIALNLTIYGHQKDVLVLWISTLDLYPGSVPFFKWT